MPSLAAARVDTPPELISKGKNGPQRVFVIDGSTVHNVGELQMMVGNWGMFGSWPGSGLPFSEAPSAQWPAGSGVEYLFTAGLWVGALKSGVAAVSTAAYQWEFRPSNDLRDIMYKASEGSRGGNRLPSKNADDDRDGKIDEDWLNGYDDDGDGLIDEDFAAISKQMFSCQYTDDQPSSTQIYPQHNPLHLHVRQESYQWEEDRFDDFVGVQFWITNYGTDVLTDLYIGFFADGDAGPRDRENYWEDDGTGFISVPIRCTDLGPVSMDIAYTYDVDGDEGRTLGYFGVLFLGHTTDPNGEFAPRRVGVTTYANFSGSQSFEDGGDPTNDFERYELLSSQTKDRNATIPRDYRMLMAAGPFAELLPGSTLVFQTCFAIGTGIDGLLENASSAQLTFEGAWFNLDGNKDTGIDGRETRVDGPASGIYVDSCLYPGQPPITVPSHTTIYINDDCGTERAAEMICGYTPADSAKYKTGVGGNESQLFWIVGTAPPPPSMRVDSSNRDGVAIYWDNFSESQPDVKTQRYDFEGYRVFRADNWGRPEGTSVLNGPGADLWKLLFQADIRNGFGEDTGMDRLRYEPLTHTLSAGKKRDMINSIKQYLVEYPGQHPPCPQGVTTEVCDTLWALAAWELGLPEGRQYYRYIDRSIHRGRPYFYAVTASDHNIDDQTGALSEGKVGDPSSNFVFVEPVTPSQLDYQYKEDEVYVVPNPATKESMQPWTLAPNNEDPTGIKVEFHNLPADRGTIRIYTVAGDLVKELPFDGRTGVGTVKWDLVSRNGQDVTSGVYIFSVETDTNEAFKRKIGKFVVIR
ncbi:MAG TPA: hypothetical protein VFH88_03580 [Candidatus Krumholzibacteria bacterium]|nr:hypothetical protein [Candidatus Krumholzibacteria bacterium]